MGERITFWYGCNVVRHGDIIHGCLDILRMLGIDARPAGGPDYCCGTGKDENQTAADGMARRTVTKFNAMGRERVVAWCPSCHSHMTEFMGQAYKPEFGLTYLVDVLYEHRAALSALLKHPVPMRVLLHKHVGFNDKVAVNDKVPALLRLVPGIEVVDDGYAAPGYMCALLTAVPKAMEDITARPCGGSRCTRPTRSSRSFISATANCAAWRPTPERKPSTTSTCSRNPSDFSTWTSTRRGKKPARALRR